MRSDRDRRVARERQLAGQQFVEHAAERVDVGPGVELLAEASRRLGWAGLIYAGTYFLAHFGPHLSFTLAHPDHPAAPLHSLVAVASMVMGLAVFVLSRRAAVRPERAARLTEQLLSPP